MLSIYNTVAVSTSQFINKLAVYDSSTLIYSHFRTIYYSNYT